MVLRKTLSALMSVVLAVGLMPASAYAQAAGEYTAGTPAGESLGEAEGADAAPPAQSGEGGGSRSFSLQDVEPIDISTLEIRGFEERVGVREDEPFWFEGIYLDGEDDQGNQVWPSEDGGQLTVEYYKNGAKIDGAPDGVGDYKVVVTATGVNGYAGSIERMFSVVDAESISDMRSNIWGAYAVGAVPALELYDDETDEQLADVDYTATLERFENDEWEPVETADSVGEYRYSIVGRGAYLGTTTRRFEVVEANNIKLADIAIGSIQQSSEVAYEPNIDVYVEGDEDQVSLVKGYDYTVSYEYVGDEGYERVVGLSIPGEYRVIVTGIGSYTDSESIYVRAVQFEEVRVNDVSQLESDHPYDDGLYKTWVYEDSSATHGFLVTFSEDTETEEDCDYLIVIDGENRQVGRYTGDELAGKSVYVKNSTTFKITLTSDDSETDYGFKVASVKALTDETAAQDERDGVQIVADDDGFACRCSRIELIEGLGAYVTGHNRDLSDKGVYTDGDGVSWYNAETGCELMVGVNNAAYKLEGISCEKSDGYVMPLDVVERSYPTDWGTYTIRTVTVAGGSGEVVVTAMSAPASTVANGVMTFDSVELPNAYLLRFDMPADVTLNGRVFGGRATRETVLIPEGDGRYTGQGVASYYDPLSEYYIWPDSQADFLFDAPGGYYVDKAELVSDASADPGDIERPLGATSIVGVKLRAPATLKLSLAKMPVQTPEETVDGENAETSKSTSAESSATEGATTGQQQAPAQPQAQAPAPETSDGVAAGKTAKAAGTTYKVTSNGSGAKATTTFSKAAKSKASASVPATVKLRDKVYQVTGIAKGAFKGSKAKTVTVKSKKLTKASVKGCFNGSKVKVVKVPKSKLKAYKKIFTKKNCGAKVTLRAV